MIGLSESHSQGFQDASEALENSFSFLGSTVTLFNLR
jgi:hypothetical protein